MIVEDFRLAFDAPDCRKWDRLETYLDDPRAVRYWLRILAWPCRGGPDKASYDGTLRCDPQKIANRADYEGSPEALVRALVKAKLLDEHQDPDTGEVYWVIHDYEEHNPNVAGLPERIAKLSEKRSEAGKKGGIASGKVRKSQVHGQSKQNEAKRSKVKQGEANASKRSTPSPTPYKTPESLCRDSGSSPPASTPPKTPPRPRTPGLQELTDEWFQAFEDETGQKPSWGPKHAANLKRLVKSHGVGGVRLRLANYLRHHKAGTFGSELDFLGSFVTRFDRWAKPPDKARAPPGGRRGGTKTVAESTRDAYEAAKRIEAMKNGNR